MIYNTPKPKKFKGQVDTATGNILEICSFYNNYQHKIKASNIFQEMSGGSSTGKYTIIVFYDEEVSLEDDEDAI